MLPIEVHLLISLHCYLLQSSFYIRIYKFVNFFSHILTISYLLVSRFRVSGVFSSMKSTPAMTRIEITDVDEHSSEYIPIEDVEMDP